MLPLIRITIPAAAILYISHLLSEVSFSSFFQNLTPLHPSSLAAILTCLLLMPLNWGIEITKWKLVASKLQPISWQSAAESVLYGISLGMITPKRTGEFAGRILMLSPGNRINGLLLNSAASITQLMITLMMGCMAVWMMGSQLSYSAKYHLLGAIGIIGFVAAGLAAILLIIVIFVLFGKMKYRSRFSIAKVFTLIKTRDLLALMGLSFCRYIVFVLQFVLLLNLMGVNLPFLVMAGLIAVIYLFMTLIPLSAILELPVRGSVALFVFGIYTQTSGIEAAILAATALLWVINLAVPALIGSLIGINREATMLKTASSDE